MSMARSKSIARATLVLALLLGILAAAILPELVSVRAAPAPALLDHVVISQFRTRGPTSPGSDGDEFIEIFNATASSVSLQGWKLSRSGDCLASSTEFYTFGAVSLAPGQYFLVGGPFYNGSVAADAADITISVGDEGGLGLLDDHG